MSARDVIVFQRISGGWVYEYTRDGETYRGCDHDPAQASARLSPKPQNPILWILIIIEIFNQAFITKLQSFSLFWFFRLSSKAPLPYTFSLGNSTFTSFLT